jgi:hypothetical protein
LIVEACESKEIYMFKLAVFLLFLVCLPLGASESRCASLVLTGSESLIGSLPTSGATWGSLSAFRVNSQDPVTRDWARYRALSSFGDLWVTSLSREAKRDADEMVKSLIGRLVVFEDPTYPHSGSAGRFQVGVKQVAGKVVGVGVAVESSGKIRIELSIRLNDRYEPQHFERVNPKGIYVLRDIREFPKQEFTPAEAELLSVGKAYEGFAPAKEIVQAICEARGFEYEECGLPPQARVWPRAGLAALENTIRMGPIQTLMIPMGGSEQGHSKPHSPSGGWRVSVKAMKILEARAVWSPARLPWRPTLRERAVIHAQRIWRGSWGYTYSAIVVESDGIPQMVQQTNFGHNRRVTLPESDWSE